jgi:hypothetical protein
MKFLFSIFFSTFILLIPMTSFATDWMWDKHRESTNNIDIFLSEPEVIIVTDFYHIGDLKKTGVGVDAVVLYKPGIMKKIRGIRVSLGEAVKTEKIYYSYIDFEQIDSLSAGINSMIELWKESPLTTGDIKKEAMYSCRGGFRVALEKSISKTRVFLSGKYITVVVAPEELISLNELFGKAKSILNSK